jgi:hypothetical protein
MFNCNPYYLKMEGLQDGRGKKRVGGVNTASYRQIYLGLGDIKNSVYKFGLDKSFLKL